MENDILDAPAKGLQLNRTNALEELRAEEREKLYQYAVNLMSTGFTNNQIYDKLISRGNSPAVAEQVVEELGAARTEVSEVARKMKGNPTLDIVLGVVFLIGGLAGTFAGTGRIFIGAIIFGIIRLIRGIINLANN